MESIPYLAGWSSKPDADLYAKAAGWRCGTYCFICWSKTIAKYEL